MSTLAQRKHIELMQRLGVRTITIPRPSPIDGPGGRTKAETKALHEQIRALIDKGKSNLEIADELGITPQTIGRHRRGALKSIK